MVLVILKNHYICPRFWCLNDENGRQRSITLKEINERKMWWLECFNSTRTLKKFLEVVVSMNLQINVFIEIGIKMKDTNNILVYKPMYPGFQERSKHPNNLCVPCCFGRPKGLSQKAIDEGWTVEEKDKKLIFKKKGTIVNKNTVPRQAYDGTGHSDYMYKPEGNSKDGAGPPFERDADGNIILTSIKGHPQLRELPAGSRIATYKDCNQSVKKLKAQKIIRQRSDESILKMEEAPAWEVFPLKTGQLGYLPESVQKFFQYNQRPPKGDYSLRLKIDKPVFFTKRYGKK